MRHALHLAAFGALCALTMASPPARASDLDASGALTFAPDALRAWTFEGFRETPTSIVSRVAWSARGELGATAFTATTWGETVDVAHGLHGTSALRIVASESPGVVIRDTALSAAVATGRLEVSMWGRAEGAEPVLVVAYGGAGLSGSALVGPFHFARVVAVRTGRETSDGWVEYSTGPIDGSVWGRRLSAILLSARCAVDSQDGAASLLASSMAPPSAPRILDAEASALIDAVEVRPVAGTPLAANTCTLATAQTDCGGRGECFFGHCVDATFVWGPAPPSAAHRAEAVQRWAYYAAHLQADRASVQRFAPAFVRAASTVAAATDARGFYGGLHAQVLALRDAHTWLGDAPSDETFFGPYTGVWSDGLDACFGLVRDDLRPDAPLGYAVLSRGDQSAISAPLAVGDMVTAIDGVPPLEWVTGVAARFRRALPNDPASDPAAGAVWIASLITRHASTLTTQRCSAMGCDAATTVSVGAELYGLITSREQYPGFSMKCNGRFRPAVATARSGGADEVFVAPGADGVTHLQFDGFEPDAARGADAWTTPFMQALAQPRLLVDSRFGNGGFFRLGKALFHAIRGRDDPSYGLFLPRGAVDEIDPPWLLGPRWFGCESATARGDEACLWSGINNTSTEQSPTRVSEARIAWVVSYDVSMNDIVPKLLQGRRDFRIFGPHPTSGAFGEVSRVPPVVSAWGAGTIQVLDARFGASADAAVAAPWASGQGVAPDEVVVQRRSDVLAGRDTMLEAARQWLTR